MAGLLPVNSRSVTMSTGCVKKSKVVDRMTNRNPMKDPAVVAKRQATLLARYGKDHHSKLFKRLWRQGKIKGRPLSERAKKLASERMKASNPMKNADVVAKMRASLSPKSRKAKSLRMKQTWAEGKITPAMFSGKGNVKGANAMERALFPVLRHYHGRFVGDGTFWIAKTKSGIRRNPDFMVGEAKDKTAILLHGTYWHRDPRTAMAEIEDYSAAGWHLLIIWTRRISKWMLPHIKGEVKLFLSEVRSSQSKTPVLHQFTTWNVTLITTSLPEGL